VLLDRVFDNMILKPPSSGNQKGEKHPSLRLERGRVAKLLSMRNAKQRSSSKRVLALIAHLPKFLEEHKIASAASLWPACDNSLRQSRP
jgi:hypothetical protein